jgi:hypothetical protein
VRLPCSTAHRGEAYVSTWQKASRTGAFVTGRRSAPGRSKRRRRSVFWRDGPPAHLLGQLPGQRRQLVPRNAPGHCSRDRTWACTATGIWPTAWKLSMHQDVLTPSRIIWRPHGYDPEISCTGDGKRGKGRARRSSCWRKHAPAPACRCQLPCAAGVLYEMRRALVTGQREQAAGPYGLCGRWTAGRPYSPAAGCQRRCWRSWSSGLKKHLRMHRVLHLTVLYLKGPSATLEPGSRTADRMKATDGNTGLRHGADGERDSPRHPARA